MSYSEDLLGLQNSDGGWSYGNGGSWTEPTCFALLALEAAGEGDSPHAMRAAEWLAARQRPDGGFAARPSVGESAWTTSLALLLSETVSKSFERDKALSWLIDQSGRESGWVFRLRMWMLGVDMADSNRNDGWPWFPETAAWVGPTAFGVMALRRALAVQSGTEIQTRLDNGVGFLLQRHCRDGGWNHGSTRALGYDSDSYPETTGLALLSLRGVRSREVDLGLARAEEHFKHCYSLEAACWLQLGLMAHGQKRTLPDLPLRNTPIALSMKIIADKAMEQGRDAFSTIGPP